jgi:hypothetical protein
MQTVSSLYEHELQKLINSEINRIKEQMILGLLPDYAEYRYICGKVAGLLTAIELMAEADSILHGAERPKR